MTLTEIAAFIKQLDCCMMTTIGSDNTVHSRPMLTASASETTEQLAFFCMKDSQKVYDLMTNPAVSLTYQDRETGFYLQVFGNGTVVDDPLPMKPHWDEKLNVWWPAQSDTEGICMILVQTHWVRYWCQGKNEVIRVEK